MLDTIQNTFSDYVDDVGGFLSNILDITDEDVQEVLKNLRAAQALMPDSHDVDPFPGDTFGTLPAGREMGVHSMAARDYLMDALREMLKILGAYDDGVVTFRQSIFEADAVSSSEMLRIARATNAGRAANADQED